MKIAFTSNKDSLISEIIQEVTKDRAKIFPIASHCFPIVGNLYGMELGLSADAVMINIVDVDDYRKNPDSILRIYEIPDMVPPEIWIRPLIVNNNQKIYPHLELIGFLIDWLKDRFTPHTKDHDNWINYGKVCSELTYDALQGAGYSGWIKDYNENLVQPTEIETLVATIPGAILIEDKDGAIIYG